MTVRNGKMTKVALKWLRELGGPSYLEYPQWRIRQPVVEDHSLAALFGDKRP